MSTRGAGKPLLLDLLGFEERSRSALEMAICNRVKGRCVLVHSSVATAVLVNLDHAGALQAWDKYCDRYPGRLAIFTSLYEDKQPAGAPFLKKPIAIEHFVTLLDRLARGSLNASAQHQSMPQREGTPQREGATQRESMPRRESTQWRASTPQREGATLRGRTDATARTRQHGATLRASASTVREAPTIIQPLQLSSPGAGLPVKSEAPTTRPAQGPPHRAIGVILPAQGQRQTPSPPPRPPAESAAGETLIEALPDIDCTVPEAVASRTHAGPTVFLRALKKVSEEVAAMRKAQRVKFGASDWITFAAEGDLVWTNVEEARFDALFAETTDTPMSVVPCLPDEERIAQGAARWCADAEAILWRAASATYRGKLPPGTDPTVRVYLTRWPNLTRVLEIPNAVRIAALWAEQRLSLAFTAEILKIPQRYVFAFYGAAHAAGLAGPVKRSEDVVVAQARVEADSRRGLFAKILSRLRRRGA